MTLYESLGVERSAPIEEIRRAFKKKAKGAHPDAGGDREKFHALVVARDVLTNDAKRAKYDATGTIDNAPDASEANALNLVVEAVDHVYNACTQRGWDVAGVDVVKDARIYIEGKLNAARQAQKKTRGEADKIVKFAKRFRSKKGDGSRIRALLEGRAADMRRAADGADEPIRVATRALEILADHVYDWSASANSASPMPQMRLNSSFLAGIGLT